MPIKTTLFVAAVTAAALSSAASAATVAIATIPLNIRSGPGPQYSVISAIPDRAQATVIGCIQGSLWCQVSYNGQQGWAYSQYLMATLSGRSLAVAETIQTMPPVTYQPTETIGSAPSRAPPIAGTLIAPPAGAPLALNPPQTVGSYVVSHPLAPVYLNGEVVEGVGLPEDVAIAPVPDSDYDYAYVNSVPVLVEPSTRRVTYVYR
ncbi:MAG: DUF1236 domain-containing protein [Pseudolabrys sp.]|jgi:uncharacterized protein YraI